MDRRIVHDDSGSNRLVEDIRRALESQDIEALAALFSDDAVLEEVSSLSPPGHPAVVRGREAIRERLEKDMLHDPVSGWKRSIKKTELVDEVETEDQVAFTEVRTYEAGDKVMAQHTIQKKNGRIGHDRVIIAWDETP